jgi:P4 family phage/plasmid primase-like protien
VLKRIWLPVDLDAIRPKGISATDAEHEAALGRATQIRGALRDGGWPDPVFGDSGNGAHLLCRIELPPDDGGLVKRCLQALAFRFDHDAIAIDQAVFNPARIWKLYGTLARKGDHTTDYPHRLARLLSVPTTVVTVPKDLLEQLAQALPREAEPAQCSKPDKHADTLDLERWIAEHDLDVTGPENWNGARLWKFSACPWNPAHRKSAYLIQFPSGATTAGCHHSTCAGKDWHALRETFEPGLAKHRRKSAAPNARKNSSRNETLYAYELGNQILQEAHFARDGGGKLYVLQGGAYRPTGERFAIRRVQELAIEQRKETDWSTQLAGQVVEWVRTAAPDLWGRPPVDRINLLNGLLDLGTLELRPHTHEFLSPIQIPISYDPAATCPGIDKFIAETFPADSFELAWEILGDLLTPERSVQKAILLSGEGGNGKGVYLTLATNFVGCANVSTLSLHRLEMDRFAVAGLYGKLANVCADLPSEHLVSTSVFKAVTGNDRIAGEYKFRDCFFFAPYCRLLFSANHPPQSKDASKAFYDRWIVVPFSRSFRGTEQEVPRSLLDAQLSTESERSGALNGALAALRRLRSRGRFAETDSTHVALEQFREVTDPLAVWLERETVTHPSAMIPQGQLLAAYNNASAREGRPPMTSQAFGRAIKRLRSNIEEAQRTVQSKITWIYLGIGLKTEEHFNQESRTSLDSHDCSSYVPVTGHGRYQAPARQEGHETSGEQVGGVRVNRVKPVNGEGSTVRSASCRARDSNRFPQDLRHRPSLREVSPAHGAPLAYRADGRLGEPRRFRTRVSLRSSCCSLSRGRRR